MGLVLGFNFGTKKGPQIQTLPYLLRGGSSFERCFGTQFWPRELVYGWPEISARIRALLGRTVQSRKVFFALSEHVCV